MNTVPIANCCPKCAAPLPEDAPQGLCPKCLLAAASTPTEADTGGGVPANAPSLETVQAAFPHLEIIELIGTGGMGAVYKVRQPKLDRLVALKILAPSLAASPAFAERFNREARVLARLNHPGIVNVFDFGAAGPADRPASADVVAGGTPSAPAGAAAAPTAGKMPALQSGGTPVPLYFLLMEYVDGVNLRQAMRAGRFTPTQALALVPRICEALQFAHDEGILHRDIKPENILLDTKGRVKIADFGIAKLVGEPRPVTKLTATGAAIGTPQYMAPEQIEHPEDVDQRADIYSLGVVFYEMLTGELPIGRFAAPSEKSPVDPRVDAVVFRTLEKERERRYGSAGEVKTSVENLTTSPAAPAPAASAPAFDPAKDFILCPPQLPRMAKAIIVYTLAVAPVLWLLNLFTIEPLPDHPLVGFVQVMVNVLTYGLDFALVILLAVGGWKLRGLRASAINWLRTAIWLRIGCGVLAILGVVWVEMLAAQFIPDAPITRPTLSEGLVIAFALAAMVFEISALVWLHRHRAALRAVCEHSRKTLGPVAPRGAGSPAMAALPETSAGAASRGGNGWKFALAGCFVVFVMGLLVTLLAVLGFFMPLHRETIPAPELATLRPYPNQVQPQPANAFNGQIEVPAGHLLQLEAQLWSNGVAIPASNLTAHILAPPDRPHRDLLSWRILSVGEPGNRGAGWNLSLGGGSNPLIYPPAQGAERPDWKLAPFRTVVDLAAGTGTRVQMLRGAGLAADGGTATWEATLHLRLIKPPGGGFHNESSIVGPGLDPPINVSDLGGELVIPPIPPSPPAPPPPPAPLDGRSVRPAPRMNISSDREIALTVTASPREYLILSATVFSNRVPVAQRHLRSKLWPANTRKPTDFLVKWQSVFTPASATWDIEVTEPATGKVFARLCPDNLPQLEWTAAGGTPASIKAAHEARQFEVARALQRTSSGPVDWSVAFKVQSQPPPPTDSRRGIDADIVLPPNQVAVFEVVTRSNGVVVPVPGLATYQINAAPEPWKGKFLWADDPDDLDGLTALPRWSFGLLSEGSRLLQTGLGVSKPATTYTGFASLWTELQADSEVLEGLGNPDPNRPTYGLRIRTQTVQPKPGVRHHGGGFGTNWLPEVEASLHPRDK